MEESIIINNQIPQVELPFARQETEKAKTQNSKSGLLLSTSFPSLKGSKLLQSLNLSTITESGSHPKALSKTPQDPSAFKADITYPDGSTYSGYIGRAMKRHGEGTLKWRNGAVYTGEFFNDMCHGKGIYRYKDVMYNGYLIENLPDGYGDLRIGEYYYEGKFFDGLKFGKGREQMPNGDVYTGMFDDGMRMGKGAYALVRIL